MSTKKVRLYLLFLGAGVFSLSGCVPLVVGGAAMGAGTGTYLYVNGALRVDYAASFERVWIACEKTVADMRGVDVIPNKDISQGTIDTVIEGEKVLFTVSYKAKEVTSVAIRVGVFGDRPSSQRLHDKVVENLGKG